MEFMKFALVTDDPAYGRALARALQLRNRNFQLSLFNTEDFCKQWKKEGEGFRTGFDIILWDREELEALWTGNVVKLTRHPPEPSSSNRLAVYKYSSATAMLAALMEYYSAMTGHRPYGLRPEGIRVLALASWQGGSGCTSVAMGLGQELVRYYGQRVLYLSFEGIESTGQYMQLQEGMKHAGEYIYRLHREKSSQGMYLDSYLLEDGYGLMAFAPSPGANPLALAGEDDMHRFIPSLMASGRFDTLLLDLGAQLPAAWHSILGYADRLITVFSRRQPQREMAFRSHLKTGFPEGKLPRILRVYNPFAAAGEPSLQESPGQREADVALRPFPGRRFSLEGTFEKDIHQLTELC